MLKKTIARVEALLKGMVFDCQTCGQCVLSQTGLICPMSCPKGLRNGPCGGSLRGECEVYSDKPCVWIRIHERTAKDSFSRPDLLPSPDAGLLHSSSYLNLVTGAGKEGREPLPWLDLGKDRATAPVQTTSRLEKRLKAGAFVRTCEVRAPRTARFDEFRNKAKLVREHFDAVNATAYLNARPSLPSPVMAAELVKLGIEAVCQTTCRDHTKTSFVAELLQNQVNDVRNVLCLTGDSYTGEPRIKQVFDMDAALMIYEARSLRETGVVHFTGEGIGSAPKPFIGAAINPFTKPLNVPIRRLKQKASAGADFIQTQLVFDLAGFRRFMKAVRREKIDRDLFVLAGIPVVTSAAGLAALPHIPGVHLPAKIHKRLKSAGDIASEGLALAKELAEAASRIPGVAGVHLMMFGPGHDKLPLVVRDLPESRELPKNAQTSTA